jgi:hypothetical protein
MIWRRGDYFCLFSHIFLFSKVSSVSDWVASGEQGFQAADLPRQRL